MPQPLPRPTEPELTSSHPNFPFLFWILLGVFLFLGINQFSLIFTASEAAPMVYAEELLLDHLKFHGIEILPAYFQINLPMDTGILVYLSMLPLISLGKQIWVVRLISIFASLLTMIWTYKIAKKHLRLQIAPLIFFLFISLPGWVLLSGTGNSAIIRCAGYIAFVYYYLEYRLSSGRKDLCKSLIAALITFYTDFLGQGLILFSSFLVFIFEFRTLWNNKKNFFLLLSGSLAALIPWLHYLLQHPLAYPSLIEYFYPYWLQAVPFKEKIFVFGQRLLDGIIPAKWAVSGVSNDAGTNIFLWVLFILTGLGIFFWIRNYKKNANRLWIMLLSPFFALLLVPPGFENMAAVIPVYLLLSCITIQFIIKFLQSWLPLTEKWSTIIIGGILAVFSIVSVFQQFHLQKNIIGESDDQTLQYGSKQIFDEINRLSTIHPDKQFILTSTWSPFPHLLHEFFLKENRNIQFDLLDDFINDYKNEIGDTIFLLDPKDLSKIRESEKFLEPHILSKITYPNGSSAYYFSELSYMINIDDKMREERETRGEPRAEDILWMGQTVIVSHPELSEGPVSNLFDGNADTLIRTNQVNPLVVTVEFETPQKISMIRCLMSPQTLQVTLTLTPADGQPIREYNVMSGASTENKMIRFPVESTGLIKKIELTITNENGTENDSIELWEVEAEIDR